MALGGHFLLLMLPAHLLLMMQRTHLLLVMLSGHLLLMIHRMLPMSGVFVLDSFVVRPGLVSLNVVIVPVVLGPKLLAMFFTAHSCSLAVFSDISRLVLSFSRSRSRTLKVMFIYVPRFVSSSRSCCSSCGLDSLCAFALASAFVFVE
jgi:hypothetical protein